MTQSKLSIEYKKNSVEQKEVRVTATKEKGKEIIRQR